MEYKRNSNYGRAQCFNCLLSPDRDDPIFVGINRLVAKGLKQNENNDNDNPIPYPCHVANRFECPYDYEKGKRSDTKFGVDDLYDLASMAFAVEISLAVARKDMILQQGLNYILSDKEAFDDTSRFEHLQKVNRDRQC